MTYSRIMNLLDVQEAVRGMSDQQLLQEAIRPSGNIPQFMIVAEKQERNKARAEYENRDQKEGTVAERIMAEGAGIMGAMPPQMTMAPQMPQRMPQMPAQGIQQAMPPQMMSGGGIVRMNTGGLLDEVLVKAPNLSDQKLEELIIDGVPAIDLVQMGFTADDISRVGSQIEPRMIREGRKLLDAAPDAIYDTLTFDSDRAQSIVDRGQQRQQEAQNQAVQLAQQAFLGRTDIPQQSQPSTFSPVGGPLAVGGGKEFEVLDPSSKFTTNISLPFDLSLEGTKFAPVADLVGRGIAGAGDLYDSLRGYLGSDDTDVSGIVAADPSSDRGQVAAPVDTAALDADQQSVGRSVVPAQQLDLSNALTDDQAQANLGLVSNDSQISKYLNLGPDGAVRAGGDDAMLPSGPERASGALEELKDLINKQSKSMSSTNRGAALVALGTGILEGKTAEGGRAAAKILSDDAKAQGALQMEGAKIAAADERERNRLAVMREDLENKLGISQNASNRTALAEVTRALAEYDGFAVRGIADKLAKGLPLTPDEKMYMTLQQAQQMLIPIVAPATKGLFANTGTQQPPPTGGSMKIVNKTA